MSKTANRLNLIDTMITEAAQKGLSHLTADSDALDGRIIHLDGRPLINFGVCSYLGLEMDPRLKTGTIDAVLRYGTQFASSRGYLSAPLYGELELLLQRIVYEAIKDAEPLTPIAIHKFPANRRRHYERLRRFPEGFVALGDAVCSFNPVYGQGMTAAALEADMLNTLLYKQLEKHARGDITGFSRRFQKKITHIVNTFWLLASSEDFRHPETQGKRPLGVNLLNSYARRVHELSTFDPQVTLLLYQVLQAIKPPTALFSPPMLAKVLFKRQPRSKQQEGQIVVNNSNTLESILK